MSNIIDSIQLSGTVYTLSAQSSGGSPTVELTQAEYDSLVSAGTVSANTYYIITDATPIDISNYWTSAQTQSAITASVSGKASQSDLETVSGQVANKQDTLVSGTNIKTINNESLLGSGNIDIQGGGGGKAVSGGTNISITTGETADTINCTLPISASSEGIYTTSSYPFSSTARKTGNVVFGYNNRLDTFGSSSQSNYNTFFGSNHYITVKGDNMFIAGDNNRIGYPSNYNNISNIVLFGYNNKSSNPYETAFGRYNVSQYSNSTFGDSGNTLFSVGNGTADNARHNAFEIRQNGDIYLSSGGTDIKLQDHLGGTASSTITSGDTNAVAGGAVYDKFDEVEQVTAAALNQLNDKMVEDEEVTAAGLNALNDKFGGLKLVKLTQTEYNNLSTKDNNTLYVIV